MPGLPNERDVTLNPTDPIPSALLNKLQDQTIGGKHGDIVLHLQPGLGHGTGNLVGGRVALDTGAGVWLVLLAGLRQGLRIKNIAYARSGDSASDVQVVLKKLVNGVETQQELFDDINPPAAWGNANVPVDPILLVGAGETFFLEFIPTGAGITIGGIFVTVDVA